MHGRDFMGRGLEEPPSLPLTFCRQTDYMATPHSKGDEEMQARCAPQKGENKFWEAANRFYHGQALKCYKDFMIIIISVKFIKRPHICDRLR